MANLATDLSLAGDHAGAERVSEETYRLMGQVRGPQHPDTLAAGANLALDLGATGAAADADRLLEDVLASLRRRLGPDHPTVTDVACGVRIECEIEAPST